MGTSREDKDGRLGTICHDLRAPLAAITMGATFVLQTTPDDEATARQRKVLEAMLRSCTQMERLIRNFADVSAIDAGTVELRPELHDAGEMLELVAERARARATAHEVSLEVQKPEARVHVRCDRERVLRALEHLADNAVDASPRGSTVTLVAVPAEGAVAFQVVDRGPGLTAPDPSAAVKKKGFGLAIARGFAASHGGSIALASTNGLTTATLSLPL